MTQVKSPYFFARQSSVFAGKPVAEVEPCEPRSGRLPWEVAVAIFLGGGATETVCAMGADFLQYKHFVESCENNGMGLQRGISDAQ